MFIFEIVLVGLGVLAVIASFTFSVKNYDGERTRTPNWITRGVGFVVTLLGGILILTSTFYTQDPGQASILKDWSGAIVGEPVTEQGVHSKAPWQEPITFDVRNQRVVYTGGDSEGDNSGGTSDGPQITVQDKDGVTSNIDIAIRYSIDPSAIRDIYNDYGSEDNLRTRLIFNDIRSVVRSVPGSFTTLELLTERDKVQQAIFEKLEQRWEGDGIIVEDVALQEVRPPQAVQDSYAAAQQAQIDVTKEEAKLEAIQVSAQQKVVQAQAEADANAILNASLTPSILQQRYLDTLKELAAAGNLVITDGSSGTLLQVAR